MSQPLHRPTSSGTSSAYQPPTSWRRPRAYPSSILADVAGRRGALHGRIQPLSPAHAASPAPPSRWRCAPATT